MKRRIFLITSVASFIVFVLILLLADRFQISSCGCPGFISRNFIYIFVSLAIVFVASLIYYFTSLKIDVQDRIIQKNLSIVLSFLNKEEKKFLDEIIKAKGEIFQSELTKRFGKLKAHRTAKKLKERGIINIEEKNKTNNLKLKRELFQCLVR